MSLHEIRLRAAASAIGQMSNTELQQALSQLKQRRNARTQMEVLQQTELASLELEHAAYQLASETETRGDMSAAARWYTTAAINDFGDASLKLAKILAALAGKHLQAQDGSPATREEQDLVTEACRWYSDAVAAGEPEADELLEKLMERHFGKSRRSASPAGAAQPGLGLANDPQHRHPQSGRTPGDPDRSPATGKYRVRIRQDAAGEQSAGDRLQPELLLCTRTTENEE